MGPLKMMDEIHYQKQFCHYLLQCVLAMHFYQLCNIRSMSNKYQFVALVVCNDKSDESVYYTMSYSLCKFLL